MNPPASETSPPRPRVIFGQAVIGFGGSGKSTYCQAVSSLSPSILRNICVVNLDPACDYLPYTPDIDIRDLITAAAVAETTALGPNGSLVAAMEALETHFEWLEERINALRAESDVYLLFDLPGQIELYTHYKCIPNILKRLWKMEIRICVVHLTDSLMCTSASAYISSVLSCLTAIIHLEMPCVNVLSKIDLFQERGEHEFDLEYYRECRDLEYLCSSLDKEMAGPKFVALNSVMCEIIQEHSLICFGELNVNDVKSIAQVIKLADISNGYSYTSL